MNVLTDLAKRLVTYGMVLFSPGVGATIITVEPDDFLAGTEINSVTPGITISVNGYPHAPILVGPGDSMGGCGGHCASTGIQVFTTNIPSFSLHKWQFDLAEFRVDFSTPTDFASIDFVGLDDGDVQLVAFDSASLQLDIFRIYLAAAGHNETGSISRASADISYILAGGVPGEGALLDNLQFNFIAAVPEPTSLALMALGLAGIRYTRGKRW